MTKLSLKLAALTTAVISSFTLFTPVKAATFGEKEVEQQRFVAVARPFGEDQYNLLILEQLPGKRDCWREYGSNPVQVEPLLLNFDFAGVCRRAADSNGYSIRVDGQDLGQDYLLNIVERDDDILLVGTPRDFSSDAPEIVLGRTYGVEDGFLKIQLNPGWEFTKRTYEGKTLGHTYLSGTQEAVGAPLPSTPASVVAFSDVSSDLYSDEIEQAVAKGFISGFPDNTFRPEAALTREQLVSMVIEALETVNGVNITLPDNIAAFPYSDVDLSRWSTDKIEWAKENQIVTGYPDGTFRPEREVTRAELLAVLRRAAEYAKAQQGKSPQLVAQTTPQNFSDISAHWAEDLISQMSAYCGVASPLNETGSSFNPDMSAQRNYAAAATLRSLNCLQSQSPPVVEQTMPGTGESEPMMEQTMPGTGESEPMMEQTTPGTGESEPMMEQTMPGTGESEPMMEQTTPGTDESEPMMEQTTPDTGESEPMMEDSNPAPSESN